jgi:hypothetical protein
MTALFTIGDGAIPPLPEEISQVFKLFIRIFLFLAL